MTSLPPRTAPGGRSSLLRRAAATLVVALALGLTTLTPGAPAAAASGDHSSAVSAPGTASRPGSARREQQDFPVVPRRCFDAGTFIKPQPCRILPHRRGAPLLVVWGDSHGWQMMPAIRAAIGTQRVNLVYLLQGSCPPMFSDLSTPEARAQRNGCDTFGHVAVDYLRRLERSGKRFRLVVTMAWELYHNVTDPPNAADERYPGLVNDYIATNARKSLKGTPRAFRELGRLGITTDLIGPAPMVYLSAPSCDLGLFQCPLPRAGTLKDYGENMARVRELRGLLTRRGFLIRPASRLCDHDVCRGRTAGVPTYYDHVHIGLRTSVRLAPLFAPTVKALLGRRR